MHAKWLEPQQMMLWGVLGDREGIKLSVEFRVAVLSPELHLEMTELGREDTEAHKEVRGAGC